MDENEGMGNSGEHSQPLEELADDHRKLMDGVPVKHENRGDRGRGIDIQAFREVMYSLHAVSIGTHQLLYFAAMKYCKNYLDADADTVESAVQNLADIFDTQNIGTLSIVEQENNKKTVLELSENALTFDADTDKPICYFISGYIAGYLENALGGSYVVNETTCTSQGNDACMFRAQKR